jgi:multiple sugar transport system permease protein
MKRKLRKSKSHTFLFLLPSLLGVLLFFVLPFGMVIWYSLVNRPVNGDFVGLDNFKALLDNNAFLLGAKNTGVLLAVSVPLAVLLPLKLALWLERAIPMKSQLRTAFLSPMLVPIASVILVWRVLFHQNGTLNAWLGANTDWFHSTWSILMVLLLYLWKNVGYHTILFTAALAVIPQTYIDMANLDGAGRTRQFYTVKLPFLAPTIFFVVLMSLIASMKIFREVYLLTSAAEEEESAWQRAKSGLEGWIECFPKARLAGCVFAGGVTGTGEAEQHPALEQAYEMGKGV